MAACIWYPDISQGTYEILSITNNGLVTQKVLEAIADQPDPNPSPRYTLQNASPPYYGSGEITQTKTLQVSRFIFKNGFSNSEMTKRNSEFSLKNLFKRLNVSDYNQTRIMNIYRNILRKCTEHNNSVDKSLYLKNGGYYFFACFAGFEDFNEFSAFLSTLKLVIDDKANEDIKQLLYRLVSMEISMENITFRMNNFQSSESSEINMDAQTQITIQNDGVFIHKYSLEPDKAISCSELDTRNKAILGLVGIRADRIENPNNYIPGTYDLAVCKDFPLSVSNLTNENPLSEKELEDIEYGFKLLEEIKNLQIENLESTTKITDTRIEAKTSIRLKNVIVRDQPPVGLIEEFANLVKEKIEDELMKTFESQNFDEKTRDDIKGVQAEVLQGNRSSETSLNQSYKQRTVEVGRNSEIRIISTGSLEILNSVIVAETAIDITVGNISEAANKNALEILKKIMQENAKRGLLKKRSPSVRPTPTPTPPKISNDEYKIPIITAISMLIIVIVTLLIVKHL